MEMQLDDKILQGFASSPVGAGFHITNRCNLSCKMCFYWGLRGWRPVSEELSTDGIKRLLDKLRPATELLSIGGGEALVRGDFLEVLKYANELDFGLEILTNGTLITPKIAEGFDRWVSSVVVSIDGQKEVNDYIRGEGSFDRSVEGLKLIHVSKKRINCTISNLNYEYLTDLPHLAASLDCRLSFQHLIFDEGDSLHVMDSGNLVRKLNLCWARAYEANVVLRVTPNLKGDRDIERWYNGLETISGMWCPFPWRCLFIEPDGMVSSCEFITAPFGKLEGDIESVWNGEKARQFRRDLINNAHPKCRRCCKLERRVVI